MLKTGEKRPALTLLEMLAATVIASMLFVALTSLLRTTANQERAVESKLERQPATQLLADLLRRDLTNAHYLQSSPSGVRLVGTIAQDWNTREPTGRLAEVSYRVAKIGAVPWLLRREVHLDVTSTQRAREELIWSGASAIEILADNQDFDDETLAPPPRYAVGMLPVPGLMAIVVRQTDGTPLLNMQVRHHWEDF